MTITTFLKDKINQNPWLVFISLLSDTIGFVSFIAGLSGKAPLLGGLFEFNFFEFVIKLFLCLWIYYLVKSINALETELKAEIKHLTVLQHLAFQIRLARMIQGDNQLLTNNPDSLQNTTLKTMELLEQERESLAYLAKNHFEELTVQQIEQLLDRFYAKPKT